MSSNNKVSISAQEIDKIIEELNHISNLCSETNLKIRIEELKSFVSSTLQPSNKLSVEDVIYEKMVKVKHDNPDLHLKLYMLYRNLMKGKISEVDAMESFENALSMYQGDVMVY